MILPGCVVHVDESLLLRPRGGEASTEVANLIIEQSEFQITRDGVTRTVDLQHTKGTIPFGSTHLAWSEFAIDDQPRPQIVFCGGAENIMARDAAPIAANLLAIGDLLFTDYPGYGESGGEATVEMLEGAADAVGAFARERYADRQRLYWGYSLGAFSCAQLASRDPGASLLVLAAPVRNIEAAVASRDKGLLGLLIRPRVQDKLRKFDLVKQTEGATYPILVLGAKHDQILPEPLALSLFEDLEGLGLDVTYILAPDADHFSLLTDEDLLREVLRFLVERQVLKLGPGYKFQSNITVSVVPQRPLLW